MYYKRLLTIISLTVIVSQVLFAQTKAVNRDKYRIHISKTDEHLNIDGILDEKPWLNAEPTGKFQRVTPTDTGFAIAQTVSYVTYDKNNLYIGAICYDPTPGKRPVESMKRDFSFNLNDNYMFFIDTYNDQTNGFAFGITAAGSQADGLQYQGIRVDYNWDIKWKSAIKSYDDKWVVECAIPFRSLRYFGGEKEWGINFGRLDLKNNEKSAWAPMPRQFPHCSLPYTGTLIWDEPLEKSGLRFSLIPYGTVKITTDKQNDQTAKWDWNAGFDGKMILSTSMNLDLTVNPDYSQVEVDKQQINLDRFELFFPEKRQFFLENSDLFSNLGKTGIQPFFSRRIGLNVPVNAGLRLTGRFGDRWRIGLMDIQTGEHEQMPSSNYGVAILQRNVFSRSSIVGFMVNKQVTGSYNDLQEIMKYNRVGGIEFNLANADNRWTGKAFYHQSFYPGASADDAAAGANLTFNSQYLKASLDQAWVGEDFNAETGYIRRTGYYEISPAINYLFYMPAESKILNHGPGAEFGIIFEPGSGMTDRETELLYTIGWKNRNQLTFNLSDEFVELSSEFDPTNTGGERLPAGTSYNWKNTGVTFASDTRKLLYYNLEGSYGGYYNGTRLHFSGTINYRVQPYGSLAIAANYNDIILPEPYNSARLFLIGPRLDITFTNSLFLTTFIQYNNQIDNLNTNIRFQWRFAPVSDLYIVYTSNSFADDPTMNKNRGLVVKLSYWFN
ncbi:MAG TPA: DUF5916 domain-containing protein [Bacteroidales bacterium]|mgnify:FL=1|nr:DUF5916 domain-containing protein [Bacteroidales bacterium]HOX75227.1 DUF5916 domain-containing protein [Bacteroidales bacterium]HPM88102.1 DUF5916 domain-containing protein [Bacteroidales bacterium]HQM70230.1 DUF5916 domain-containing protein [Bacteroidales bacterium]